MRVLQDPRIPRHELKVMIHRSIELGISRFIVNGCWENDWKDVLDLAKEYPGVIIPQLGLHPLWVGRRSNDWLQHLRKLLVDNPSAGLGECGLDKGPKCPKDASYQEQIEAFEAQLKLGQELCRPVTIHCVKAFGAVFDSLKRLCITVPVILHAWTGSKEMSITFKTLPNVFFSLNGYLTKLPPLRAIEMLQCLPTDRCLLESDAPDGRASLNESWKETLPGFYEKHSSYLEELRSTFPEYNPSEVLLCTLSLVAAATGRSENQIQESATEATQTIFCFDA